MAASRIEHCQNVDEEPPPNVIIILIADRSKPWTSAQYTIVQYSHDDLVSSTKSALVLWTKCHFADRIVLNAPTFKVNPAKQQNPSHVGNRP